MINNFVAAGYPSLSWTVFCWAGEESVTCRMAINKASCFISNRLDKFSINQMHIVICLEGGHFSLRYSLLPVSYPASLHILLRSRLPALRSFLPPGWYSLPQDGCF